jgi:hypothetical protein
MSDEARVIGAISAATGELDAPLKRELAPERRFESCWNALEKVPFLKEGRWHFEEEGFVFS